VFFIALRRNDLAAFKVARDAKNVYFYARTQDLITPPTGANWMWLLIDIDQDSRTGWAGYDYIINRTVESEGETWLENNEGGWRWKKVARVTLTLKGKEVVIAVPRTALGLRRGETRLSLDFKWADHLQHPGEIMDFYISGDVAPEGMPTFDYLTLPLLKRDGGFVSASYDGELDEMRARITADSEQERSLAQSEAQDTRASRVVEHRDAAHGQQRFRPRLRQWTQPRAEPGGEKECAVVRQCRRPTVPRSRVRTRRRVTRQCRARCRRACTN
jgi:hypothetical protein